MAFTLPNLPYPIDALAPHLSKETLEFHHGKHHATYVNTLNDLIKGTKYENASLDEIVKTAEPGKIFNNAAQHWNHSFYWTSMKPNGGGTPSGKLADAIKKAFGDFESFRRSFRKLPSGSSAADGLGWSPATTAPFQSSRATTPRIPSPKARPRCSPATSGNMPTTSITATPAQSTSRLF